MAVVFQDSNGDGYRQADEPVEKEVEITAGLTGKGEPTDKTGRTIIGGLAPFVPVLIGIDASSLPDPFIQPANSGVVVTPRPGVPMTVELPLVAIEFSFLRQHIKRWPDQQGSSAARIA